MYAHRFAVAVFFELFAFLAGMAPAKKSAG
jgi:hypothetical protein